MQVVDVDMVIESDASDLGWGVYHQGVSTSGPWSVEERSWHINYRELLAVTLALQTFVRSRKRFSVLLKVNNITAVAYINNQGGQPQRSWLR